MEPGIKQKLLAKCFEYVDGRIENARQAMEDAQDSANAEEKSSAGDKYETGRAMAQIERDKAAVQLDEAIKLKSVLGQINPASTSSRIELGSLVITNQHWFYLSISMGKVVVDGQEFLFISPNSPIGQALLGLKVRNHFTFNKQQQVIGQIL